MNEIEHRDRELKPKYYVLEVGHQTVTKEPKSINLQKAHEEARLLEGAWEGELDDILHVSCESSTGARTEQLLRPDILAPISNLGGRTFTILHNFDNYVGHNYYANSSIREEVN